jgi:tripartite-type tricarboxylate transporter receptor subunit TctC
MHHKHWATTLGWSLVVVLALGACSRSPAAPAAKPAATEPAAAQPAAPAAASAASAATDDQAVADFYRGRVVRLIVGLPAGGGYDAYARNVARVMGKYIPGNPTIVVENMAGASSVVASNHVYNIAPKDGSVILHYQGTVVPQQAFGARGIEFDALKFQHLGAPAHDTEELNIAKRAGLNRFDEMLGPGGREVVLGGIAPGALTDDLPKLLREVLGARVKLVSGYSGTAPVRIAVDAGELDGFFNAWESTKITNLADVESGNWLVLLQVTERPHPDLPNVPLIGEFTRTEEQRQLFRYGSMIPSQFTRPFAVAPGVPADRVRALREAFARTMTDEDFLAAAEKGKMAIEPQTGEQIQKLMEEYFTMPEDVKNRLREILLVS